MGFSTLIVTLTNYYQNVLLFLTLNSQFHQILAVYTSKFPNYFELVMVILIMVIMLVMLVMVVMVVMVIMVVRTGQDRTGRDKNFI